MKLQEKGFSLLEMMITLVIIGAVTYAVVMQSGTIYKSKSKAVMDAEINQISFIINNTLADPASCTKSLQGFLPGPINEIVRKGSSTDGLFTKVISSIPGQETVAPGVKVKAINLVNDGPRDYIRVTFQKTSNNNVIDINQDFFVLGNKNSNGSFSECLGFVHSLEGPEICKNLKGGVWTVASQECDFPNHLKNPRPTLPIHSNGNEMLVQNLQYSGIQRSCTCHASRRCSLAPTCSCNLTPCPSPQVMETPRRRVNQRINLGYRCLMQAKCFNVLPLPGSPIGKILDNP